MSIDYSLIPDTELAYAAGIIDGEGCIHVAHQTYAKGWKSNYRLQVTVLTTDNVLCPWLCSRFGGSERVYSDYNTTNGRSPSKGYCHRWMVVSLEATAFLEAILPYLLLKKDEAILALQFRGLVGSAGKRISDENRQQRVAIYDGLRLLKQQRKVANAN